MNRDFYQEFTCSSVLCTFDHVREINKIISKNFKKLFSEFHSLITGQEFIDHAIFKRLLNYNDWVFELSRHTVLYPKILEIMDTSKIKIITSTSHKFSMCKENHSFTNAISIQPSKNNIKYIYSLSPYYYINFEFGLMITILKKGGC